MKNIQKCEISPKLGKMGKKVKNGQKCEKSPQMWKTEGKMAKNMKNLQKVRYGQKFKNQKYE